MRSENVKCPKCRFRFTEQVDDGCSEKVCACPRCGTPFVISFKKEDYDSEQASGVANNIDILQDNDLGKAEERHNSSHYPHNYRLSTHTQTKHTHIDSIGSTKHKGSTRLSNNGRRQKEVGCLLGCLLSILLAIIVLLVSFVSNIFNGGNQKARIDDTSKPDMEGIERVETSSSDFVNNKQTSSPEWIQGNWNAETEFFIINVNISGNTLTETDGNYSATGTFVCKGNELICLFEDKSKHVYILDHNTMTIDCGENIILQKRD